MTSSDRLLRYPKEFIQGLSEFYPLTEIMMTEYEYVWDWRLISKNTVIEWNERLLAKFEQHWDWHNLSKNGKIPFTVSILEKFKKRWNWCLLGGQTEVVNDPELLNTCISRWTKQEQTHMFERLFAPLSPGSASWSPGYFESCTKLDWESFSSYEGFLWTPEFIHKNAGKLDWKKLSYNAGLPLSTALLEEHTARWDWAWICLNKAISWNMEMLETFQDRINWAILSSEKRKVQWTADKLIRFKDKLYWVDIVIDPGGIIYDILGLYNHPDILWTPQLYAACNATIEKYFQRLAEEKKDAFEDNDMELMHKGEHWAVYLNGANWSEPFFWMMVQISKAAPCQKMINWSSIGSSFSKWKEWSKEAMH